MRRDWAWYDPACGGVCVVLSIMCTKGTICVYNGHSVYVRLDIHTHTLFIHTYEHTCRSQPRSAPSATPQPRRPTSPGSKQERRRPARTRASCRLLRSDASTFVCVLVLCVCSGAKIIHTYAYTTPRHCSGRLLTSHTPAQKRVAPPHSRTPTPETGTSRVRMSRASTMCPSYVCCIPRYVYIYR
jgi:hypothetical protein